MLFGQSSRVWKPAVYRGLVMGESSREDVLQKLGTPQYEGREQDTGVPIMSYSVTDPEPGELAVYIRNRVLRGMTLTPARPPKKTELIRKLGSDFLNVHYSFDECLSEGGTAPLYQDPNGRFERIEYRSRGLSLIIDNDEVQAIVFAGPPFPATKSRCLPDTRSK